MNFLFFISVFCTNRLFDDRAIRESLVGQVDETLMRTIFRRTKREKIRIENMVALTNRQRCRFPICSVLFSAF